MTNKSFGVDYYKLFKQLILEDMRKELLILAPDLYDGKYVPIMLLREEKNDDIGCFKGKMIITMVLIIYNIDKEQIAKSNATLFLNGWTLVSAQLKKERDE